MQLAANEERPSTAVDMVTATMTVGPGDGGAVIPDTDNHIRGGDYLFDMDIVPCDTTFTFTNSSDNQFHHVIVVDFGTNDAAAVEDGILELVAGNEDSPPACRDQHEPGDL